MKRLPITLALLSLVVASTGHGAELVVGGKSTTEQRLISALTARYLEEQEHEVDVRIGMGSIELREAQQAGDVDLYWEYSGIALNSYHDVSDTLAPDASYERARELDAENGLVWLAASRVNNTYGLAMREQDAAERGIASLSDLAEAMEDGEALRLATPAEFQIRDDGLDALLETYELDVALGHIKRVLPSEAYTALRDEEVDLAVVFATDGRIPAFDLRVLTDDQGHIPAYVLAPVVRESVLEEAPEIEEQLEALSSLLDNATMAELTARVEAGENIEDIVEQFLSDLVRQSE